MNQSVSVRNSLFTPAIAIILLLVIGACSGGDDSTTVGNQELIPDESSNSVQNWIFSLSPAESVPPLQVEGASAEANIVFDPASNILTGGVSASGLTGDAFAAHIHRGFAGDTGDVVRELLPSSVANVFSIPDNTVLLAEEVTALMRGEFYINVHTDVHKSGEVRGQIVPAGISVIQTQLTGDEVVPPIATEASGIGVLTLQESTNLLWTSIRIEGISAIAAHIHEAPKGVNGDISVPLNLDPSDSRVWRADEILLAPEQTASILAGAMYFNVHSNVDPTEIRGQITP